MTTASQDRARLVTKHIVMKDGDNEGKQEFSSSWDWQPFGHNRRWPKSGGCCAPLEGRWVQSNTVRPGPRPTSVPSSILIHPNIWPQYPNVTDRQTDRTTVPLHGVNRFTNGRPKTCQLLLITNGKASCVSVGWWLFTYEVSVFLLRHRSRKGGRLNRSDVVRLV